MQSVGEYSHKFRTRHVEVIKLLTILCTCAGFPRHTFLGSWPASLSLRRNCQVASMAGHSQDGGGGGASASGHGGSLLGRHLPSLQAAGQCSASGLDDLSARSCVPFRVNLGIGVTGSCKRTSVGGLLLLSPGHPVGTGQYASLRLLGLSDSRPTSSF